jgi:hypothetical protein
VGAALSSVVVALVLGPLFVDGGIAMLGASIAAVGVLLLVLNAIALLRGRGTA